MNQFVAPCKRFLHFLTHNMLLSIRHLPTLLGASVAVLFISLNSFIKKPLPVFQRSGVFRVSRIFKLLIHNPLCLSLSDAAIERHFCVLCVFLCKELRRTRELALGLTALTGSADWQPAELVRHGFNAAYRTPRGFFVLFFYCE